MSEQTVVSEQEFRAWASAWLAENRPAIDDDWLAFNMVDAQLVEAYKPWFAERGHGTMLSVLRLKWLENARIGVVRDYFRQSGKGNLIPSSYREEAFR